jgi:hypothetical protein
MKIFSLVILSIFIGLLLCVIISCTYSITMVHTEGTATDVVDETQRADPDIKTNLSIPATAL